jgi:hypothetical protein
VRRILERGHTPVLFNRGRTRPAMFPEMFEGLETLVGDRDGDIGALRGGRWDAVIDDSGYTPQQVRATAELLRDSVGQYLFTSTRAVYQDFTVHMDEDAPVGTRGVPESRWEGYGPLKALAEREVRRVFPDAATIVRPAIITGPGDNTDRFTYWYVRVDRGGEVLAPGDPSDPIQYIDVRDMADFYVHLVEQRTRGVFNLEAPGRAAHHRRLPGRHPRHDRHAGLLHLGRLGLPPGARAPGREPGAARLARPARGEAELRPDGHPARPRRRADAAAAGDHRHRHPRVVEVARHLAAGRPPAGEGARGARRLAAGRGRGDALSPARRLSRPASASGRAASRGPRAAAAEPPGG